jgi:hypothetical protein
MQMSSAGFCIALWPEWREAVARFNKTQSEINTVIEHCGRAWLDGCGFDAMFDPDTNPMDQWEAKHLGKPIKYGPNARPLYEPKNALRVQWGLWGPEHITVPGDACGLDLDTSSIMCPKGGRRLTPHNVDNIRQAHLLLVVFTCFAESIILQTGLL